MSSLPDPNERAELAQLQAAFRTGEEYVAALVFGVATSQAAARAVRQAQAATARRFVRDVRRSLDAESRAYLRRFMPQVYLRGMTAASAASASAVPLEWSLLHKRAVSRLVRDTFGDLAAATSFMEANAVQAIRQAAKVETLRQVTTGAGDVGRRLAADLERRGVTGFVDRAGRRWRLSRYSDMVIRTKRQTAYNTGNVLRHVEQGTVGQQIIDGTRSDEACADANGRTCSNLWALQNPLEHPNCTRTFGPLSGVPAGGFDFGSTDDTVRVRGDVDSTLLYTTPPAAPAAPANA